MQSQPPIPGAKKRGPSTKMNRVALHWHCAEFLGLITQYQVPKGNPVDEQQVEPLLKHRKETFDHAQHKAKMLRYR